MKAVGSVHTELTPGTYVELPCAGREGVVRGLVHDTDRRGGVRYVSLYSYATRRVERYRLDRRGKVHTLARRGPASGDGEAAAQAVDSAEPSEESASSRGHGIAAPLLVALMAALLALVVIVPLIQGGAVRLRSGATDFQEFLDREMSLSELVSTVSARVDYRPDLEEYWSAPASVWNNRDGDCEDYALLLSAYLRSHEVPHRVIGMALKPDLQGHVAVIAEAEDGPVLLDPTRATAPTGLKRYPEDTGIAEIAEEFAVLPVDDYGSSPTPGDPLPLRRLE